MKHFFALILAGLVLACGAPKADAVQVFEIDLTGFESWGGFTNTNNTVVTIDLFPNAQIVSIEWVGLEFQTENGSWRSELVLSLNDSTNSGNAGTFWDFRPTDEDSSGTYSGSGFFSSPGEFNSGPFSLLADGQAIFYVYETFDDGGAGVRDALITAGTLRITAVPEPSTFAVLGGVVVLGGVRRVMRAKRMA